MDLPNPKVPPEIAVIDSLNQKSVKQTEETKKDTSRVIELGFNSIEAGVTINSEQTNGRIRAIDKFKINFPYGTQLSYHGLNEICNVPETYFGKQVFGIGIEGFPFQAVNITKIDANGIMSNMIGIRDNGFIPSILGDYGFVDVVANENAANLTGFIAKEFNNGSLWFTQAVDVKKESQLSSWTEIQLNRELYNKFNNYFRVEMPDFDVKKANILVGLKFDL